MKIDEMEKLILSLKDFKEELTASEDKRDINQAIKIIDITIEEKRYYRN